MKKILKILLVIAVLGLVVFLLTREIDLDHVLKTGGLIALAAILFAETGLLIGFFLPGDTLLFAAGFFAAQGRLNLIETLLVLFLGTFIGNIVGYEIGRRSGSKIFKSEEAILFNPDNIEHAKNFYTKHGGKTIIIARFIPIVRTIAPLLAGIGKMEFKQFMLYNFIGGILWVGSITLIGYWAGKVLGHYFNIDKFILPIVIFATLFSLTVSFWHVWKDPSSREKLKKSAKNHYRKFATQFKK